MRKLYYYIVLVSICFTGLTLNAAGVSDTDKDTDIYTVEINGQKLRFRDFEANVTESLRMTIPIPIDTINDICPWQTLSKCIYVDLYHRTYDWMIFNRSYVEVCLYKYNGFKIYRDTEFKVLDGNSLFEFDTPYPYKPRIRIIRYLADNCWIIADNVDAEDRDIIIYMLSQSKIFHTSESIAPR